MIQSPTCEELTSVSDEHILPLVTRLEGRGFFISHEAPFIDSAYKYCKNELVDRIARSGYTGRLRLLGKFLDYYGLAFIVYDPSILDFEEAIEVLEHECREYMDQLDL